MLHEELGVTPGTRLSDAYRHALVGATAPHRRAGSHPEPQRPPWRGPGPPVGPLFDRERELEAVTRAVAEHRLLTVTGPPGAGKSVLALQSAARVRALFAGGVAVLECSEVDGAEQLTVGLSSILGAAGDQPTDVLEDEQLLLLLDNVEHLARSCVDVVDDILRTCRTVTVLVTSRELLGLPYEAVQPVLPLAVPDADDPAPAGDEAAVRLFAHRAKQVCPGFRITAENAGTVASICRRLDGLPLALELAATCLATDTLDDLMLRMRRPLHEITSPRRYPPAHQHSLWTTLRRSVDMLDVLERRCFVRLARLPATFDQAGAGLVWNRVPGGPVDARAMLRRLVDASLVSVTHQPGPRYRMLRLLRGLAAELGAAEQAGPGAAL
jgi:predicted ATPase